MGWASRVTPGIPHRAPPDSSLPIENSPPGIQTMPSGATPAGRGFLFSMVGRNDEPGDGTEATPASVNLRGSDRLARRATAMTMPATSTEISHLHALMADRCSTAGFVALESALVI